MRDVTLWELTAIEMSWREKAKEIRNFANRADRGKPTPASPCRTIEITDELREKYNTAGQ